MQEKLGQKYFVPSNCTRLEVIPCDSEVFKNSNAKAKTRDSSLQSVQKYLMKGLTAVIFAFDALSNSDDRTATEMLADGVTLLANGSHKLDVFRRHAFKGDMKDEYSSICNAILLKALSLALTCTKGSGRSMSRCASLGPPAAFNHIKNHKKGSLF